MDKRKERSAEYYRGVPYTIYAFVALFVTGIFVDYINQKRFMIVLVMLSGLTKFLAFLSEQYNLTDFQNHQILIYENTVWYAFLVPAVCSIANWFTRRECFLMS